MVSLMWRKSIVLSRKYSYPLCLPTVKKKLQLPGQLVHLKYGLCGQQLLARVVSTGGKKGSYLRSEDDFSHGPQLYPSLVQSWAEINAYKKDSCGAWGFFPLTWAPFVTPLASFRTHMGRHIWGLEPVNKFCRAWWVSAGCLRFTKKIHLSCDFRNLSHKTNKMGLGKLHNIFWHWVQRCAILGEKKWHCNIFVLCNIQEMPEKTFIWKELFQN